MTHQCRYSTRIRAEQPPPTPHDVDITKFRPPEAARNLQQAGHSPVLTTNCEIHDLISILQGIN